MGLMHRLSSKLCKSHAHGLLMKFSWTAQTGNPSLLCEGQHPLHITTCLPPSTLSVSDKELLLAGYSVWLDCSQPHSFKNHARLPLCHHYLRVSAVLRMTPTHIISWLTVVLQSETNQYLMRQRVLIHCAPVQVEFIQWLVWKGGSGLTHLFIFLSVYIYILTAQKNITVMINKMTKLINWNRTIINK